MSFYAVQAVVVIAQKLTCSKRQFHNVDWFVAGDLARFPHRSHSGMSQPLKAAKTADFRCLALVSDGFALLVSVASHRCINQNVCDH
jgi:hypothetical protein